MTLVVQIIARCNSIVRQRKWKLETLTYSVTPPHHTRPHHTLLYKRSAASARAKRSVTMLWESLACGRGGKQWWGWWGGGGRKIYYLSHWDLRPSVAVPLASHSIQTSSPTYLPVGTAEVCTFYDEKTLSSWHFHDFLHISLFRSRVSTHTHRMRAGQCVHQIVCVCVSECTRVSCSANILTTFFFLILLLREAWLVIYIKIMRDFNFLESVFPFIHYKAHVQKQ